MTPSTVLVATEAFSAQLDGARAARAIGRGLHAGNAELEPDPCPIEERSKDLDGGRLPRDSDSLLPKDLDVRMHSAHAVLIAAPRLNHETLLRRDAVFEIATRARQTGVPCYAIAGSDELDLFEARILDLQVVLEAGSEPGLAAAAKKLAGLM